MEEAGEDEGEAEAQGGESEEPSCRKDVLGRQESCADEEGSKDPPLLVQRVDDSADVEDGAEDARDNADVWYENASEHHAGEGEDVEAGPQLLAEENDAETEDTEDPSEHSQDVAEVELGNAVSLVDQEGGLIREGIQVEGVENHPSYSEESGENECYRDEDEEVAVRVGSADCCWHD